MSSRCTAKKVFIQLGVRFRAGYSFKLHQLYFNIPATINLKNTGSRDADEIVQLYIRDMVASISRPVKELKGFQRIHLAAGESREISFDITPEMLKFYNAELKHVIEPGDFQIMVGGNSKEVKTQNLTVK